MRSESICRDFQLRISRSAGRLLVAGVLLTALALPGLSWGQVCVGDCDDSGTVTVNELVTGVNIALGTAAVGDCAAMDENSDGAVTVNELVKAVNNALEGCGGVPTPTPGAGLGERVFSVLTESVPFSPDSRSMLGSSALQGNNVASAFSQGPLLLVAGEPNAEGVATLALAQDAIVGMIAIDGRAACLKFFAEGSSGTIDCDGGPAPNLVVSQASGPDLTSVITFEDGPATGPGAAKLQVMVSSVQIPPPSASLSDCETATYGEPTQNALTTATGTATKGAATLSLTGENFSCDDWTTENGPGMLVMPNPGYEPAAGGDSANVFRFADQ